MRLFLLPQGVRINIERCLLLLPSVTQRAMVLSRLPNETSFSATILSTTATRLLRMGSKLLTLEVCSCFLMSKQPHDILINASISAHNKKRRHVKSCHELGMANSAKPASEWAEMMPTQRPRRVGATSLNLGASITHALNCTIFARALTLPLY